MFSLLFQKILFFLSLFAGIFSLLQSREVTACARDGIELWAKCIVPTLLPYIILSGFWIKMDILPAFLRLFQKCFSNHPFFAKTFPLFLTGILCGFPTGAIFTQSFYEKHFLTKEEARILLPLCSFISPMFLTGYLAGHTNLSRQTMTALLLAFYGSAIFLYLCFLLLHILMQKSSLKETNRCLLQPMSFSDIAEASVFSYALHAIFTIGLYILLFTILAGLLKNRLPQNQCSLFLLSNLEITTGISILITHHTHSILWYSFLLFLLSLGGLCTIAQVYSLIDSAIFSMPVYLGIKIMQAIFAICFFACIFFLSSYFFVTESCASISFLFAFTV